MAALLTASGSGQVPGAARADNREGIQGARGSSSSEAADALLERCIEAERRGQSLQADYRRETRSGGSVTVLQGTFQLRKPNLALIRLRGAMPDEQMIYRSDALNFVSYRPAKNDYFSRPSDASGRDVQTTGCVEAAAFFDPSLLKVYRRQGERIAIAGAHKIDGEPCSDLVISGGRGSATYHLFIGPDGLLRGMRTELGAGLTIDSRVTRHRANAPIPQAVFAWRPPTSAKPSPGSICRLPISDELLDPALTEVGRAAPNFPLSSVGSEAAGFSGFLRKHRLVMLNFWGFG